MEGKVQLQTYQNIPFMRIQEKIDTLQFLVAGQGTGTDVAGNLPSSTSWSSVRMRTMLGLLSLRGRRGGRCAAWTLRHEFSFPNGVCEDFWYGCHRELECVRGGTFWFSLGRPEALCWYPLVPWRFCMPEDRAVLSSEED